MNTKQKLDTCLLTVPGRWDETYGFLQVSEAAGALTDTLWAFFWWVWPLELLLTLYWCVVCLYNGKELTTNDNQ